MPVTNPLLHYSTQLRLRTAFLEAIGSRKMKRTNAASVNPHIGYITLFFQQLAVSPPETKYVSVTSDTTTWLIYLVPTQEH